MDLILNLIQKPENIDTPDTTRLFAETGGTLGRSATCTWAFKDPQRLISNKHATITYQGGQYLISDESTNGLRLNGASTPLGPGKQVLLTPGDTLQLGEVVLQVSFDYGEDSLLDGPFNALPDSAPRTEQDASLSKCLPTPVPPDHASTKAIHQENSLMPTPWSALQSLDISQLVDPLELLTSDNPNPHRFTKKSIKHPKPHHAPCNSAAKHEDVLIPEHWDLSQIESVAPLVSQSAHSPVTEKPYEQTSDENPKANARPSSLLKENDHQTDHDCDKSSKPPQVQQPTYRTSASEDASTDALLTALGLMPQRLSPEERAGIAPLAAALLQESLNGLIQLQRRRQHLKRNHRLNQTIIAPHENNPLKFSASAQDALLTLLTHPSAHYLSGPQAISALFQENERHEMAVTQAHQAAHRAVMAALTAPTPATHLGNTIGTPLWSSRISLTKRKWHQAWQQTQARLNDQAMQQDLYDRVFRETYEKLTESSDNLAPNKSTQQAY